MSFTFGGYLGTAKHQVTSTELIGTFGSDVAVNKLVVIAVATDEGTAANGATNRLTLLDSAGNIYLKGPERAYSITGDANNGIVVTAFYCVTTFAITGTVTTYTLTSTEAVNAKAMIPRWWSFTGDSVQLDDSASAGGFDAAPSVTSGAVSSIERLWIGVVGAEYNVAWTEDADYTGRNDVNSGNNDSTSVEIHMAERIATITGDTYAPAISPGTDWVAILMAFSDPASGGGGGGVNLLSLQAQGEV